MEQRKAGIQLHKATGIPWDMVPRFLLGERVRCNVNYTYFEAAAKSWLFGLSNDELKTALLATKQPYQAVLEYWASHPEDMPADASVDMVRQNTMY